MEKQQFEDVFPIQTGDFPASHVRFTGVVTLFLRWRSSKKGPPNCTQIIEGGKGCPFDWKNALKNDGWKTSLSFERVPNQTDMLNVKEIYVVLSF